MSATISKYITKSLCDEYGGLDFNTLNTMLQRNFTFPEELLLNAFFDAEKFTIHPSPGSTRSIDPDSRIIAKTSLRLCQKKPGECRLCDGLHLCRYLVCGNCTFGDRCTNPHLLHGPHNDGLLVKHDLLDLQEKQLFNLLLQNDPFLLPEICSHYNKGTCRYNDKCTKLHVCQHHIRGECRYGQSCKLNHCVDVRASKALKGFSQEKLLAVYKNKCIISHQEKPAAASPAVGPEVRVPQQLRPASTNHNKKGPPPAAAKSPINIEKDEICLFFVRKACSLPKGKCIRVHWHLPYRWQVLDTDGVTWKDMEDMEEVEKAFCDPQKDNSGGDSIPISLLMRMFSLSSHGGQSVDFIQMTSGGSTVRRLSTASSASRPPHFILTTEWVWYWAENGGIWHEFGQSSQQTPSTVTSATLESLYLADKDSISFDTTKYSYLLHFKPSPGSPPMYQENLTLKTKREVRRRPRFVSAQDVANKLRSGSSSGSSPVKNFPSHWVRTSQPDIGYKKVQLDRTCREFMMIQGLFRKTMSKNTINSIHRIQNLSLWEIFHWQREQMTMRNGGKPVTEQHLFHGTNESLVEAICEQNFDWRMCGVHGTAYGKGSYFARDASYSNRYAQANGTKKVMFAALVLVGDYTRGSSSYLRPPPRNGNTLYDSCVDDVASPSIYVIFEKQQIYPEYIIDYS